MTCQLCLHWSQQKIPISSYNKYSWHILFTAIIIIIFNRVFSHKFIGKNKVERDPSPYLLDSYIEQTNKAFISQTLPDLITIYLQKNNF